jgi:hypothetical protein
MVIEPASREDAASEQAGTEHGQVVPELLRRDLDELAERDRRWARE